MYQLQKGLWAAQTLSTLVLMSAPSAESTAQKLSMQDWKPNYPEAFLALIPDCGLV